MTKWSKTCPRENLYIHTFENVWEIVFMQVLTLSGIIYKLVEQTNYY